MAEITIGIAGKTELIADLRKLGHDVRERLKDCIQGTADEVVSGGKMLAPQNTGKMASSVGKRIMKEGLFAYVHPGVRYGAYVEYGSGAQGLQSAYFDFKHHVPMPFPNVDNIKSWARARGLNPFLVARAIFRKQGIRPRLFLSNAATVPAEKFEAEVTEIFMSEAEKFNG